MSVSVVAPPRFEPALRQDLETSGKQSEDIADLDRVENLRLSRLVAGFIVGFVALTTLRMLDCLPQAVVISAAYLTKFITVISMPALGFEVEVRVLGRIGGWSCCPSRSLWQV